MKTSIADLLASMENDDPDIRADAACDIGESGTKDKRAIAALIRHLKDDNSQVRAFSARALGGIGGKAALKPLINSLSEVDSCWNSNAAANALGDLGNPAAVPRLITLLSTHPNDDVRRAATLALAYLKAPRAVRPLTAALLGDSCADVRFEAADALGYIADRRAVPGLITALSEAGERDSVYVREHAAMALAKIGDGRALGALRNLLKSDKTSRVREAAREAIKVIERVTKKQSS